MAQAAVCIVGCNVLSAGKVSVTALMSTDTGVELSTSIQVDFAVAASVMELNIKNKSIAILAEHGATVALNDLRLFGGPS